MKKRSRAEAEAEAEGTARDTGWGRTGRRRAGHTQSFSGVKRKHTSHLKCLHSDRIMVGSHLLLNGKGSTEAQALNKEL